MQKSGVSPTFHIDQFLMPRATNHKELSVINIELNGEGDEQKNLDSELLLNTNPNNLSENGFNCDHRRNSGNLVPSPRRSFHSGGGGGPSTSSGACSSRGYVNKNVGGGSSLSATCSQGHHYNPNLGPGSHPSPCQPHGHMTNNAHNHQDSKWATVRKYIRGETKTFFGLEETSELKEEWLSRRKRFASRRYSERNVDSMPPPSPYQPPPGHLGHANLHPHDQPDAGRIPAIDSRAGTTIGRVNGRSRRTRKKDHVFVIYWNLIRWIFWVIYRIYLSTIITL
jgi:hypothetical protein